jgi:molybdopterin biosynthesis enzyme
VRRLSRVSVERACAWIDEATTPLAPEDVSLERAAGRVLGVDFRAAEAIPAADCAAIDRFAVPAAATSVPEPIIR